MSRLRVLSNSYNLMGIALDFVVRSSYDLLLASNNNASWTLIAARYLLMSIKSHFLLTCMMSIYNYMSCILRTSCNIATTFYLLLSSMVSVHDIMSSILDTSSKVSTTRNLLLSSVVIIYKNMSIATSRNMLLMSSTNNLLWSSMVCVNNQMLLATGHLLRMCSRNNLISCIMATTYDLLPSMMSSYHNLMVTCPTNYLLIFSMSILMLSCILDLIDILRPSDNLTRIAHNMFLPASQSSF